MSDWVKVEDRLPEAVWGDEDKAFISNDVALIFADRSYSIGSYDHDSKNWTLWLGDRNFILEKVAGSEPTHWLPLPEAPK